MKILIQNYTSTNSSEPYYLNNGINLLEDDFQSAIWDLQRESVYDILDKTNPDIVVCHVGLLSKDLIKYLVTNPEKNIRLIINITGLVREEDVANLENVLEQNNINCLFMFSNNYDFMNLPKPQKNKFFKLLPAANIDQINIPSPDFNLANAIISTNKSELFDAVCEENEVYHKIKIGNESDSDFDFFVNTVTMSPLYKNYDNVILVGKIGEICGQFFFDALLKSENISLKIEDSDNFTNFLSEIFYEEEINEEELLKQLKNQIIENHTSTTRCRQFVDQIKETVK